MTISLGFHEAAEQHPDRRCERFDVSRPLRAQPRQDGGRYRPQEHHRVLSIHGNELKLTGPVEIEAGDDQHLRLRTSVDVDRKAAGVGWSKGE